jgi:HEAT repeat protein
LKIVTSFADWSDSEMNLESAVELLRRADSESKIAGLRNLPPEVIGNDGIMALVLDALGGEEPDTRYAAIQVLKKAALGGRDVAAALPLLNAVFEDFRFPSHLSIAKNRALSIGCEAAVAAACYHLRQGDVPALRNLVVRGGWPGWMALSALRSASTAREIKPFLPLLREMLECSDDPLSCTMPWSTMRQAAAGAVAEAYWLSKDWQALEALIGHEDEQIRLGAIGRLDGLAEAGRDIQPILPRLLTVFDQSDVAFDRTRQAAARVLCWFVLKEKKKLPVTFHIAGVDIRKIPEVKKEVAEVRAFKRRFGKDR